MSKYIKWFHEITMEESELVGGKSASLGEMYQNLTSEGILVPNGFAVTVDAYVHILNTKEEFIK